MNSQTNTLTEYNNQFIQTMLMNLISKGIPNNQVQRIVMSSEGITDDCNSIADLQNTVPILATWDQLFRNGDTLISSPNNETSPVAAPIVTWIMYGGTASIKIKEKFINNQSIEKIAVQRLDDQDGIDASYTVEYSTVRIVELREVQMGEQWFVVCVARAGGVWNQQLAKDETGADKGQFVIGKNFIKNEPIE